MEYLCGLRFLRRDNIREILAHRQAILQLDELFAWQIQASETRVETAGSENAENGGENESPDDEEGIEDKIAMKELEVKQIQSSVRDSLQQAMHALFSLQDLYAAQKSVLLDQSAGQWSAAQKSRKLASNKCLDLLGNADSGSEEVGR